MDTPLRERIISIGLLEFDHAGNPGTSLDMQVVDLFGAIIDHEERLHILENIDHHGGK